MICRRCGNEIPDVSLFCNLCGTKQEKQKSQRKRGNKTGSVYKLKNGMYQAAVVVAKWKNKNGKLQMKRIRRNFAKKSDAVLALTDMIREIGNVAPAADLTLRELWEIYSKSKDYDSLSKSQSMKMRIAWNRWKDIEFRGIRTLTVADIEDMIESKTESYYPARDMKVCLSHLFDIAVKREIVQTKKTDYADIPYDPPKAKRECWSQEEVDALWNDYNAGNSFTAYIIIMCYAGLRYGELATIPLSNIDLGKNMMQWGIKSDAGIDRVIPIHPRIKPLIERIILQRKQRLLEMNEDNFYDAYWKAISRAGLRELPPHTCRHYFFSRLTSAGVQGGIIAEVGGHASYLTTLKNYVRVPLEDKRAAVDRI